MRITNFVLTFCLVILGLSADESADFTLDREADPSAFVHGCVNAISGSFLEMDEDIVVRGPEPLSFIRFYNSAIARDRTPFGLGFSTNHPLVTGEINFTHTTAYVWVEEVGGSYLRYHTKHIKYGNEFYLDGYMPAFGLTNSSRVISGQTNLKNTVMRCTKRKKYETKDSWEVSLSNGGKRLYIHQKLKEETLPSGNHICYSYDKKDRPLRIWMTDSTKETTFSWLAFEYPKKGGIVITASDGQSARYNVVDKSTKARDKFGETYNKHYNRLDNVSSSTHPTSQYKYHMPEGRITCEIARHTKPEGRYLETKRKDHLVTELLTPLGRIFKFNYDKKKRSNDVFDAYGNKTTYRYSSENWLKKVIKYQGDAPYTTQCFFWGNVKKDIKQGVPQDDQGGNLITKGLQDPKENLIRATHYVYDNKGNPLKEIILGNLTGKYPHVNIQLDDHHKPCGGTYESYCREKTFSTDGFYLVLSEKEEDGRYTEFTYLPNTNLITSKLVYDSKKICMRHFFEYNAFRVLSKTIIDDGSTPDQDDLSGVSERKTTTIKIKESSPGIGQPESIQESYLNGQEQRQLKRTEYVYGFHNLVTEERVYDENDVLCFTTYIKYDEHENVIEKIDPLGTITLYAYDANDNKIYEEKIGSGHKIRFVYDLCNNLICQEDIHDDCTLTTHCTYDLLGRKTSVTDHYGNVTCHTYDAFGREVRIDYPHAYELKEYDYYDNVSKFTDKEGGVTLSEYNINGKPTKITHPNGSIERFEYQKNGLPCKKWEKSGASITYFYDLFGRVIREEGRDANDLLVYTQSFIYNAFHLLRSIDKMGHCTEYRYDGAGRKIAEIKCDQKKTLYGYDTLGRPASIINENSIFTQTYDHLNRVIAECTTDLTGKISQKTTFAYDVNDNKIRTTVHIGPDEEATTHTLYNSKNELITEINPLGHTTHMSYLHAKALTKTTTDPLGNRIIETFNAQQKITSIEKQNAHLEQTALTTYLFDKMDRELMQTHGSHYTIRSSYDVMGQIISLKEMDKETLYAYDCAGRLQTVTKPDGVTLNHSYDAFGHLLTLSSSDGSIDYAYTYDLNDHLIHVLDHGKQAGSSVYNDLDLLVAETLANGHTLHYAYDARNRLTLVTLPDHSSIRYIYDALDLICIERYDALAHLLYAHEYLESDWRGNPLKVRLIGNAGELHFAYDLLGRQTASTCNHFNETIPADGFDAAGNLLKIHLKDTIGELTSSYAYDDLYQLTRDSTTLYTYDSIYNRLSKDDDLYTISSLNQVTNTPSTTYTYDKNGNLIQANETSYFYDALNRLIATSDGTTYTYDSSGRRMSKGDEIFLYQKACEIGSYDSSGALTLRIIGRGRESEVKASVAIETPDGLYAPIHNHRGGIVLLLDASSGKAAETLRYTAFGEATLYGADITPWQFSSKRFDPETGFIYFSNRYYTPVLGRWLTPDPLGFADGPNLYAYVHNSPLIFFDPYGLCAYHFENGTPPKDQDGYSGYQKAGIYGLGRPEFDNIGIGCVHGIGNGDFSFNGMMHHVGEMTNGYNISGVFQSSHGIIKDGIEYVRGLNGTVTRREPLIHQMLNNFFDNHDKDARFLLICHSRGSLDTANALSHYSEEKRSRVTVLSIAPGGYINKDVCEDVMHYRAKAYRDIVPRIDVAGAIRSRDSTVTLRSHPDAKFMDHEFQSPTYKPKIQEHINDFIQRYEKR